MIKILLLFNHLFLLVFATFELFRFPEALEAFNSSYEESLYFFLSLNSLSTSSNSTL